jgi:predicted CXXCH cytochrome family protein
VLVLARVSIALLSLGVLAAWALSTRSDLERPRNLHQVEYATSQTCTRCHGDHAASFRRTFHRTMTQLAGPDSVLGDFSNARLSYFGAEARFSRGADGAYWVSYGAASFASRSYRVVKTVGSRRYQQYLAERDGVLVRLPVAWHIAEKRWFHMNGAFLTPDPALESAGISGSDYERHVTRWNDNCVFCHNVRPDPGLKVTARGPHFDTTVAEHGIACEACHGPGEEHQRVNEDPMRRYALHLSDRADPTIVNPSRLSPERSADACGRCHGQRMTDDVHKFLTQGDPFIPGEDLSLYSAPLWRDTALRGDATAFSARFWRDGTPRLTAYEYQAMLQSRCASEGELTCTTCHGMHEGDPRGQIRPSKQGDAMCIDCHEEFAEAQQKQAHSHHSRAGGSPQCVDCHMPKITYGVLDMHVTHRIERPDPARAQSFDRPDACTLCHVERTRAWAAQELARLWKPSASPLPEITTLPELEHMALAGDPVQRVTALHALGQAKRARGPRIEAQSALLLEVMQNDPYPAVRRFARDALAALQPEAARAIKGFVPEATPAERRVIVANLRAALSIGRPAIEDETLRSLRARASEVAIEIGE